MRRLLFLCLVMYATSATADIQLDILTDKVNRLDAEMTLLQRKVYQSPTSSAPTNVSGEHPSLDDLYTQLDDQNRVIQELTAKIEEVSFRAEQTMDRLNKMNADIDYRLKNTPTSAASTPTTTDAASNNNKEQYESAYALLKKAEYATAEKAFSKFIAEFPNSSLAGNANYWLGETYYVRGLYEQAAGVFADSLTKYRSNPKAADSMLKLGLTMKNLNKKDEACSAFIGLPHEFQKADTPLKTRAQEEAKKLACPS